MTHNVIIGAFPRGVDNICFFGITSPGGILKPQGGNGFCFFNAINPGGKLTYPGASYPGG